MTSRVISEGSTGIQPERIDPDHFHEWQALLDLILKAFDYMNGLIDPPSSALRLTPQSLQQKAQDEIGYVIQLNGKLAACAFFRPEPPDYLYIGKLAVSPEAQGHGLGTRLFNQALTDARRLGLPKLRLETRIELNGNHEGFGKWGFVKTAENAHAGYDRPTSIEMQRAVD